MKKIFSVLIMAVMVCFALAGCSSSTPVVGNLPEDATVYYTVTFDSQGGSHVESQRVFEGNPIRLPETPKLEGYSLRGWYKTATAELTEEWDFETDRVTNDITLYAGWTEIVEVNPEYTQSLVFTKVGNSYTVTDLGEDTRVIIPAEYNGLPVKAIGESAFARKAITYVSLPDSITEIALNAFHNCSSLEEIKIGEKSQLTSIGRNAFSGNHSLKSIYLPVGLKEIGDSAFNNCGGLDAITVAAGNRVYSSEGNNLIECATHKLIRGSNNSVIPESVTEIAKAAFRKATKITELIIPKSVTTIGNYFIADSSIITITYEGSQSEWDAIEKSTTMWNYGNRNVTLKFNKAESPAPEQPMNNNKIYITIGNTVLTATLVENSATEALKEHLKTSSITIDMSDYGGWEKVGGFGFSLPTSNSQITAQPCEFVLYQGDQLVIFYGSNSWNYTRLGKIDNITQSELKEILGTDNITITLSLESR